MQVCKVNDFVSWLPYPLQITKINVPDAGLFKLYNSDPEWRNEADCGEATYKRSDGSIIDLNCAGPKHTYFR